MRSLFEEEEKEIALNKLKVNLLSRFYPFTREEIIKYKPIFSYDYCTQLINNDLIQWDTDLLELLGEKFDWKSIYKIKNIKIDISFIKNYSHKIYFTTLHWSKSIVWSDEILSEFGEKFNWSSNLIKKEPLSTIQNLRRFRDKLDWGIVSRSINLPFNEDIINEFSDKWDWAKLSLNPNLPLSVEFIQKYL